VVLLLMPVLELLQLLLHLLGFHCALRNLVVLLQLLL
jgi:hypothetical protein